MQQTFKAKWEGLWNHKKGLEKCKFGIFKNITNDVLIISPRKTSQMGTTNKQTPPTPKPKNLTPPQK